MLRTAPASCVASGNSDQGDQRAVWRGVDNVTGTRTAGLGSGPAGSRIEEAVEATTLAHALPAYLHRLQNHNSELGKLNAKYHLEQRLQKLVSGHSTSLAGGILAAGKLVLSTVSSAIVVAVLSIYFLAGLPRIKLFAYRLVPNSRRPGRS